MSGRSPSRARRSLAALAVGLALLAPPARAGISLIPIPEVIADPNAGLTYGLLPTLLLTDPDKRLEHIVASDIRYNKSTGIFPAFRLLGYPTEQRRYYVVLRKSTKIDEEYEGFYEDTGLFDGRLGVLFDVWDFRDSLQRFFGFGNLSRQRDETNYTLRRFATRLRLAYRPLPSWEIAWQTRFEDSAIARGGVRSLPFIAERFPGAPGLEGATVHGQGLRLAYDDRDSPNLPTRGMLVAVGGEIVERSLGSSSSYARYGFEVRDFVPIGRRHILALRGALDYLHHGSAAPFFERGSIGGQQAVRGFGDGRFRDMHRFLASVELRNEVLHMDLFGVPITLEMAPFVDVGRVFASVLTLPFLHQHIAGGLGFRAVIRPQVVGYVDFGYGSEGIAAFSGLDYPF